MPASQVPALKSPLCQAIRMHALAHQCTVSAQADQESAPESTYQAQFDTVNDEWTTVQLPWHEFVPVKRAQVLRWFTN